MSKNITNTQLQMLLKRLMEISHTLDAFVYSIKFFKRFHVDLVNTFN